MYLGDGLLFELQNGKPKLIVLEHGVERNLVKNSLRPRLTYVLNSRQPSCADDVRALRPAGRRLAGQHPGNPRSAKGQAADSRASFASSGAADRMRGSQTASKPRARRTAAAGAEAAPKIKSECPKSSSTTAKGTSAQSERWAEASDAKSRSKDLPDNDGLRDTAACLSGKQVPRILSDVQTSSHDRYAAEEHRASTQPVEKEEIVSGGEMEEDRRGCDETKSGISPPKDGRSHGGLFGWLEQHDVDTRASVEAKKAQWRQQLNEQVALKQQQQQQHQQRSCSTSLGLQVEEGPGSVCSVQLAGCHKEQPAAIRSSLRLGTVTPIEEALAWERREEQRRLWLEDLDRQREETSQRRRREKMLHNQKEDHELWAAHFDSMQRKPTRVTLSPPICPPVDPPGAPPSGDWEVSSSLSLTWDALSSCGAESVGKAREEISSSSSRYPTRSSHLRSMTALLDPVQMEERERRRQKQLEHQRDIQAQMEERRQQRQEEEARRRMEEDEEERRITLERDLLNRRYQQEDCKHREERKEEKRGDDDQDDAGGVKESVGVRVSRPAASAEDKREKAVQTEAAPLSAGEERPPSLSKCKSKADKENTRAPGGGKSDEAYEAFARTEKKKEKMRPQWNTHRPSRRFVPASERYPATLQRSRRESRLERQEEVLGLQHRNCLPTNRQEPRRDASRPPSHKEDSNRISVSAKRGRSPPITQPSLQYIPYIRTDDVVHQDPIETADAPPPHAHTASRSTLPPDIPSSSSPAEILVLRGTQRQQEILRGLAQLRQGLLQKQRELKGDLQRHGNERLVPPKC
ncbi:coiled-coil domain-containing protein 66 isoform X3 [Hippocampus zosterae]|uniref:coiled-coil domain-containing protein 66 isoform X3 n=1 Tax=Hippocampus zosterae TaxID=109293 RepID=UPI00223E0EDE|nr:coiled-coil domain-containing protein 66 isoform X3 [Hippocampus zosterae]